LTWLDMVAPTGILKMNNYSFKENFALTAYAPNNLLRFYLISLDDLSIYMWCSSKSKRARPTMAFDFSSLLSHSINLFKSTGVALVHLTIPQRFLFINCIWIFTFHVWKLKPEYLSNDISTTNQIWLFFAAKNNYSWK